MNFPKLSKTNRTKVSDFLKTITRVNRPELVDLVLDGRLAKLAPIPYNQTKNAAYRTYYADRAISYSDESERGRDAGNVRSQAETVRAYLKRIFVAYEQVTGEEYPSDQLVVTPDTPGTVQLWVVE